MSEGNKGHNHSNDGAAYKLQWIKEFDWIRTSIDVMGGLQTFPLSYIIAGTLTESFQCLWIQTDSGLDFTDTLFLGARKWYSKTNAGSSYCSLSKMDKLDVEKFKFLKYVHFPKYTMIPKLNRKVINYHKAGKLPKLDRIISYYIGHVALIFGA